MADESDRRKSHVVLFRGREAHKAMPKRPNDATAAKPISLIEVALGDGSNPGVAEQDAERFGVPRRERENRKEEPTFQRTTGTVSTAGTDRRRPGNAPLATPPTTAKQHSLRLAKNHVPAKRTAGNLR
jgi:hypothetical protein